jgi:hypothetical protein
VEQYYVIKGRRCKIADGTHFISDATGDCSEEVYPDGTWRPTADGHLYENVAAARAVAEKYDETPKIDTVSKSVEPASDTNPKDLIGASKVPLSLVPAVAVSHAAHALADGRAKYGAYNWRQKKVQADIYVDACLRHIQRWFDGREELAGDSRVHHLGHAIACLAILLDAQETGNLVDNRPAAGACAAVHDRIKTAISEGRCHGK